MVVPTFLMGCLPTYKQLGWSMTVLLVIGRLVQGLAVGGELIGTFILTLESSYSRESQGFWGATTKATCFLGSAVGMFIVTLLRFYLTYEQMLLWGWRIPFYLGIVFGAIGLYLRLQLQADIKHENMIENLTTTPFMSIISMHKLDLILVIVVTSFWVCSYYICCVWFSYFLSDPQLIGHNSIGGNGFFLTFGSVVTLVILFPIAGLLADKLGAYLKDRNTGIRYTMILATVLMMILILPAMYLLTNSNMVGVIFGLILIMIPIALFGACLPSFMLNRFSQSIRYTSCGLAYNMSHAIFASTASVICMLLLRSSKRQTYDTAITTLLKDSAYRPCYYLILISIITLLSLAIVTPRLDKIRYHN